MASLQHNRFRRCTMSSQWSFCFGLLIPFVVLFARASKCVNARNNILKVAILRVISLLFRNKHQVNFLALYVSEFGPFVAHFLSRNTMKQIRNGIEDIISDLCNDLSLQRFCTSVVQRTRDLVAYATRDRYGNQALCGSVKEHQSTDSVGLRFVSSGGIRVGPLCHARGKTKKSLYIYINQADKLSFLYFI